MTRDEAKREIEKLVREFEEKKHIFANDEAQTRRSLIDKFWEALGWNLGDPNEVKVESRVREDTGGMKRVDYALKLKGKEKFIVEAKPPRKNLRESDIVYQLINYGWNLPTADIGILHDFDEFRAFDVRLKPNPKKPERGLIKEFDLTYRDYIEKFDLLYNTFSREAVLSGSLEKLIPEARRKERERDSLDKSFFNDLMNWRLNLAKSIVRGNPEIDEASLNEATNMLILRTLFLRIVEDRDIEGHRLDSTLREWECSRDISLYEYLIRHFRKLNPKYNGILFKEHFSDYYKVDDKPLYEFLTNLYPHHCDYRFDLMPVELLGNVYERFLGTVIRITPKRILKAELKPEVRKAGGVYYTPKYIVDYIVEQTVGKLLKGDPSLNAPHSVPPNEGDKSRPVGKGGLTPSHVRDLKILDPACGSGSFLIGAYEAIYNYLLNWYKTHPKSVKKGITGADLERGFDGQEKLGLHVKQSILVNNLYGVDVDPQAIEVTMFSLYVKLMEGEGPFMFKEVLPDLSRNIKCGNSLIGTDIFDDSPELFENKELRRKINPFDWEKAFPEVFRNGGGFDAVIGNPPYVNIENLEEHTKKYFFRNFEACKGRTDIYIVFIENSLHLLKDNGSLSFIIPFAFTNQIYGTLLREKLINNYFIKEIVDISNYFVFSEANVKNIIINIEKSKAYGDTQIKTFLGESDFTSNVFTKFSINQGAFLKLKDYRFETKPVSHLLEIKEKIWKISIPFGSICFVAYGARLNHRTKKIGKDYYIHQEFKKGYKPFLEGRNIERYYFTQFGWLDYRPDEHYNPMFPELFENEKIMFIRVVKDILRFAYDNENFYNSHTVINCVRYDNLLSANHISVKRAIKESDIDLAKKYDLKYLLGVLNSRWISWYFNKFISDNVNLYPNDARNLPIRAIDFSNPSDVAKHDWLVLLVARMLELHKEFYQATATHEKEQIQRLIQKTDEEIDKLVYELYGLTEEEIKIIESAFFR